MASAVGSRSIDTRVPTDFEVVMVIFWILVNVLANGGVGTSNERPRLSNRIKSVGVAL